MFLILFEQIQYLVFALIRFLYFPHIYYNG